MAFISSIIIGVFLVFGLLNGLRRGGLKEGTALVGVLLGALLVEYWARRWGQAVSQRSGLKLETATWLLSLGLLLGTALLSGYGSGLLIRRHIMKSGERLGGALLGLLNMGLLVSFTLRYTQQFYFNEANPAQQVPSWIRSGLLSRYMLEWVGLVLLGAAGVLALLSIITGAMRLGRLATRPVPTPAPKPQPTAQPQQPKPQPTFPPRPAENNASAGQSQKLPVGQQERYIDQPPPRSGP